MLKQRDGAAAKLLDLLNESKLLAVDTDGSTGESSGGSDSGASDSDGVKGGGKVLKSLTRRQRELVKSVGSLSRSLLRQATSQLNQRTYNQASSSSSYGSGTNSSIKDKSNSRKQVSNVSGGGKGNVNSNDSNDSVISATLLAALTSSLDVLLDALPFICIPLNQHSDKVNNNGNFENANSQKSKILQNENIYGGNDVVEVITDIVFGISEVVFIVSFYCVHSLFVYINSHLSLYITRTSLSLFF